MVDGFENIEQVKSKLINLVREKMNDLNLSDLDKWKYLSQCYSLGGHYEVLFTPVKEGVIMGYGGGHNEFLKLREQVGI